MAKASGLYIRDKLGVKTAGAFITGNTDTVINTSKMTTSIETNESYPGNIPTSSAFSISQANIDTILSLLNANYVMHICITYLIIIMIILYIAYNITSNKCNLLFIECILGKTI